MSSTIQFNFAHVHFIICLKPLIVITSLQLCIAIEKPKQIMSYPFVQLQLRIVIVYATHLILCYLGESLFSVVMNS